MKNKFFDNKTRVRFAPSPTGFLHIGSARTALFNWLYARKTGGSFIIRIEDTDLARHQEEAVGLMLESLKWLGMDWDEGPDTGGGFGPYRQSERLDIYRKTAQGLIEDGKAYICFCSPEDLARKRKSCQKNGGAFKYDRSCLSLSTEEIIDRTGKGEPYTIRLLVPENKILEFNDIVYGNISVNSDTIEDYIIIRSNGLPTYNYSVAVDDAMMRITHIIRGEDHLSNTPKQLLVYNAMGTRPPQFIHLPMILGSDGQKLSKRHGSISIETYREEGFMPEAIVNYIALLGWAYDETTTIFSISDLISRFSLENINKKSARFDYQKLLWMNGNYIRGLDDSILEKLIVKEVSGFLDSSEVLKRLQDGPDIEEAVKRITPHMKERLRTIKESSEWLCPFFTVIEYGPDMRDYFINKALDARAVLNKILAVLGPLADDFTSSSIESRLRVASDELGPGLRKIAEAIRIAIWAKKVSPPLFETMEILGHSLTIKRINDYLEVIA